MKTLEKAPKASNLTPLSLETPIHEKARILAKAEGVPVKEWLENLILLKFGCTAEKRPIMFPAAAVQLLEELLEASGTLLSIDDYAEEFLQLEILDSLDPLACGVPETLAGRYQLEPGDMEAMQAAVDRWKAKDAASA